MNQYTKIVMVPQDSLGQQQINLQQQEIDAPLLNQLSSLDSEMQAILSSQSITPEMKMHKYMQTLQRYQLLKEQQNPTLPQELFDLDTVPKNYRNKARMLLHHLKAHQDRIKWTPDNRLKIDGITIKDSNITDLIHGFTRPFNRNMNFPGAVELDRFLTETNAPKLAITPANSSTSKSSTVSTSSRASRRGSTRSSSGESEGDGPPVVEPTKKLGIIDILLKKSKPGSSASSSAAPLGVAASNSAAPTTSRTKTRSGRTVIPNVKYQDGHGELVKY